MGNDAAAQAGIDGLIADFADHPELPGEVYKIEAQYWRMKRYEDVKLLCEYIAENHSDSDLAIKARTSVAAADILLGNYAAAQAGIDAVIRDFAEDPELARMLWKLGIVSWIGEKYDWSRQFYQRVVDTWPESSYAKRSQIGIIRADIKLGGNPSVLAGVDELIADFADHPELPGEVYELAYDCHLLKRYEDARQLWQRVVDSCPDRNDMIVMRSRIGVIMVDIDLGDDPSALAGVDALIANFYDHPRLPQAVFRIGEQYYRLASAYRNQGLEIQSTESFAKAITVWERILRDISVELDPRYPPHAYYSSAISFGYLGQHETAINYYQALVDNWPDYKFAGIALFRIGRAYESLRKSGAVSKSEADSETRSAYEQLLEKYPTCIAAKSARRWLDRHN
ncbi:Cell division coordinator CpoB [subsurface metagenome]